MKHFWALPAFLRLVLASQHQFSVRDDVFAYPQYEIFWDENSPLSEEAAQRLELDGPPPIASQETAANQAPETSLGHRTTTDELSPLDKPEIVASYESMVIDGQRYLCSIPYVPAVVDAKTASNRTAEEEEQDLALATERGWELLRGMEGSCIYFVSGWWSYSFCYNEGVRQFHQMPPGRNVPVYPPVEDKSVSAYSLGRVQKDVEDDGMESEGQKGKALAKTKMRTKGESRYLVQHLKGGTTCDLTGQERNIEIQFHCQEHIPSDRISLIKETLTCEYLMVIWTPRLCNDAAFLPPEATKPHAIDCAPVMAENFIPAYLAGQEHEDGDGIAPYESESDAIAHELMEELAEAVIGGTSGKAAMQLGKVGDIEIGAYRFLPKGTKLEKGAVVGGGKEKILATIAKSNGYMASDRELAKLSIRNNKDVEAVKKEVERVAEGKEWQLDVVETPRGRELRGIIAKDEDEKTTKTKKKLKPKQKKVDRDEDDRQDPEVEVEKEAGSDETYKEEL